MSVPCCRSESGSRRVRAQRGFTLLEIIVVLVLASLLMTLLTQALWMGLDLLRRSRLDMGAQATEMLRLSWYRETVAGLQPEQSSGPYPFKGDARAFAGMSTGAPIENLGAITPVQVSLTYAAETDRTRLQVRTDPKGEPMTLLDWPGRTGEFLYLDEGNKSYEQWPPGPDATQLPRAIVLKARPEQAGPLLVYTAVAGERRTPVSGEEAMLGIPLQR